MGPVDSHVSGPGSFFLCNELRIHSLFFVSVKALFFSFFFFNNYIDHLPSVNTLCLGKAYYSELAFSESSHPFRQEIFEFHAG